MMFMIRTYYSNPQEDRKYTNTDATIFSRSKDNMMPHVRADEQL